MPERWPTRVALPVLLAAGGLVMAVLRHEVVPSLLLAAAFALGHLLPLRTTGGRLQPMSPAVAAAALLTHALAPAVWGAAVGLPLGWLAARLRFGERSAADLLPGEIFGSAAFLAVFAGLHGLVARYASPWADLAILLPPTAAWHLASA
ncbi:MAG: hypothetical protein H6Q11_239, partial [Acidobacteria bacterium]|nr:hypothetical protein [Acidobacteriota bacterium]